MEIPYYLKVGRADDLQSPKERMLFRFFEILPGSASWLTIFLAVFLSWLAPLWIAYFIIAFVVYWFFRTIHFSFYLKSSYQKMRENEQTDWRDKLKSLPKSGEIYQLIILPMYKEPFEVARESLDSLLSSDWPKDKMIIVLTCEEEGSKETAQKLTDEFKEKFFKFLLTYHPSGLPGEMAGKGSNETWGAKLAKDLIIDPLSIPYESVIFSSFDADTVVFPKYFSCLAYHYLTEPCPTQASFQPIPLFTNNIWQAKPISRLFAFSATFWQMMCQERPEKLLTFSSHSMSFKALVEVGFRQTNVVSDDSRIFWQGFFVYNGNYRVVPLYYPISMDANCVPSLRQTLKNIYLQQRRWAYGVGDIPYVFFGFLKNKKIALSKKLSLGLTVFEGHWSWATSSILIFTLGWLPLIFGGKEFGSSLLAYKLPNFISKILTISMLGLIVSIYFSILLLPPKPPEVGRKKYVFFVLEWLLLPFVMIFFTSLPALDAQTRWIFGKYMGFWPTPKTRDIKTQISNIKS